MRTARIYGLAAVLLALPQIDRTVENRVAGSAQESMTGADRGEPRRRARRR